MKITKERITEIIKEEIEGMSMLASSIDDLSDKIDALDVSIDYLASAMTGQSALSIGATQGNLGRAASAKAPMREEEALDEGDVMSAIEANHLALEMLPYVGTATLAAFYAGIRAEMDQRARDKKTDRKYDHTLEPK
jgi:hypothetical protein